MLVIPDLVGGVLPPGIHVAEWADVVARFGTTAHRTRLLVGLRMVLLELAAAGCTAVYLDGSFVTEKEVPSDFDLCWDIGGVDIASLDTILVRDLAPPRAAQKAKYLGDVMPNVIEAGSGQPFVDFFQIDKNTGKPKGIVALDPRRIP